MLPINLVLIGNASIFPYPSVRESINQQGVVSWRYVSQDHSKGNGNAKRNLGARHLMAARQPYVFFCDEDVTLMPGILMRMLGKLIDHPNKAYCYCDWIALNHPCNGDFIHRSGEFDGERLKAGNYISTMSLMRHDAFDAVKGFDESIERLQDWDLWLSMLERGFEGIYLPEIGFTTTYGPDSVTKKDGYMEAARIVRTKHGL